MHAAVFTILIVWQLGLAAMLAFYVVRATSVVHRALALDAMALIFVATLGMVAIHRGEAGYLDIALMLAMLGFVQTVATARLVEARPSLR